MTKRDYIRFAAMFAGELALAKGEVAREVVVRNLILSTADLFAQDNARFDRGVFYIACGLTEDGQVEPTRIHGHIVLERKKSRIHDSGDVVLVDRGEDTYDRFVTGIVSSGDRNPVEWFWGRYFVDRSRASLDLLSR